MYRVASSFCAFVCSYLFYVFGSLFRHIFRFQHDKVEKPGTISSVVYLQKDDFQIGLGGSHDSENDNSNGEKENSVVLEAASSVSTSKCEFLSGKGIHGYIEEPKNLSFTVREVFVDANNDDSIINTSILGPRGLADNDLQEHEFKEEGMVKEKAGHFVCENSFEKQEDKTLSEKKSAGEEEVVVSPVFSAEVHFGKDESDLKESAKEKDLVENLVIKRVLGKHEKEAFTEKTNSDKEETVGLEDGCESERDSSGDGRLVANHYTVTCGAEKESPDLNDEFSGNTETDPITNEFAAKKTVNEAFGSLSPVLMHEEKVECNPGPEVFMGDQSIDSDDEYIELEPQEQNSVFLDEETLSRKNLSKVEQQNEQQDLIHDEAKPIVDSSEESEEPSLQEKKCSSNCDAHDETDFILEHQDLIEQLKMELKRARSCGLPTIQEESESEELETPKLEQKLKPLKIDVKKFEQKDVMHEIQKVYKSYLDKMRKLDILNFQTMHALGLLRLTDTFQFKTVRKLSGLGIKSLLLQSLWSCKQRTAVVEPTKKIIADMNSDFEAVYVGQLCLSWEILHWQYQKFQEVQKNNCSAFHQYNHVAGEFQLFQVLLQRFVEDEPFHGHRVQNYAKNRCVLRNLLQVPVIKDDNLKDKAERRDDENAITSPMLMETIEDSMQGFWEFLRADKHDSNVILQYHTQTLVNLKNSIDLEFFIDIQTKLMKKEKRLKDILRSGNCIVRRFQKNEGEERRRSLFIAQVELRLVSRVLNMSRLTTDQLIWCHEKLDKINICRRTVFVESSFMLFPC